MAVGFETTQELLNTGKRRKQREEKRRREREMKIIEKLTENGGMKKQNRCVAIVAVTLMTSRVGTLQNYPLKTY